MSKLILAEEGIESLFGAHDQNLKYLEKSFGVRMNARGNELNIEGEAAPVATVRRVMEDFSRLCQKGYRLRKEDVRTATRVVQQAPETDLVEFSARITHPCYCAG
jgi:phosphate starvation-inducible PhoH-like protein